MLKISRFVVAPALGLALSLSVLSPGAFAQSVNQHNARSVVTQPSGTGQANDGPSPIFGGNNGGGGWDFGGFGNGFCNSFGNGFCNGFNNGGPNNGGGFNNGGPNNGGGFNNGGGPNNGGGFNNWTTPNCGGRQCAPLRKGRVRRCKTVSRVFRFHGKSKRFTYLACKWFKTA